MNLRQTTQPKGRVPVDVFAEAMKKYREKECAECGGENGFHAWNCSVLAQTEAEQRSREFLERKLAEKMPCVPVLEWQI